MLRAIGATWTGGLTWPPEMDDRHVVVQRDIATVLAGAQAGAVVRRIRIIFPTAAIGIELGQCIGIGAGISRIGCDNTVHLKDEVRKIDEAFNLLVAVCGGRGDEFDVIRATDHERHRPAGWN